MKVLIYTASTGNGHNMAAKSLKEMFENKGHEVKVVDLSKLRNKIIETLVSQGYDVLSGAIPLIYKGLYNGSNTEFMNKVNGRMINKVFLEEFRSEIESFGADLMIGTHPFAVRIIHRLKMDRILSLPYICIVTDFKAHRMYISPHVDAYITASTYTKVDLMEQGVPGNKVYPYGIPLRKEFYEEYEKPEYAYGDPLNLLILVRGLGATGLLSTLKQLLNCKHTLKIRIVYGGSYRLLAIERYFIQQLESAGHEVAIYGYTNDMHKLMNEAHVLITKPGGLTVSEALMMEVPMIIPSMIPGQEEENAEFLRKMGVARVIKRDIYHELDSFMEDPEILAHMRNNIRAITYKYTIEGILTLAKSLIKPYEKTEKKSS